MNGTFTLNGQTFTEGDCLTITAPEIGTYTVPATMQRFCNGTVVGLDFGFVQTPHACKAKGQTGNARLSIYSNGKGYNTMQVAYLCSCPHQAHPRFYAWNNVAIEGDTITAGPALPQEEKHYPPVAPASKPAHAVEPVVKQEAVPVVKPKPVQLSLF